MYRQRKIINDVKGPGGWKCTCCGPAPKHRTAWMRQHKRAERAEARKELEKFLTPDWREDREVA